MTRSLPRPAILTVLCALASLVTHAAPVSGQALAPPAPNSPYWSAAALRADVAAVGADPFAWAAPGTKPAPTRPSGPVPSNVAHLSLRRPYTVALNGPDAANIPEGFARMAPVGEAVGNGRTVYRLTLVPRNPFDPAAAAPAALPPVPKDAAADTYQAWMVAVEGTAWDALEAAWAKDAIAVRKAFRTETKQDWPVTTSAGPRAEANRLAAARWVRRTWDATVRQGVSDLKRTLALRGPVLVAGPADAALSALSAGDAASGQSPALVPRVTDNAVVNRYGVGFLVRLASDLGGRIPWPTLDLSALELGDAAWGVVWLDEVVRNGVQGLTVTPPRDGAARARVLEALEPLRIPNIYLPPPSEVGILVSRDTAALEPGAWSATFLAYAALRERGVWPDFVSDEQVSNGAVALARFRILVVPAAEWADRALVREVSDWVEGGGVLFASDAHAFSRAEDGWDTSSSARALLGWASAEPPEGAMTATRITPAPGVRVLRALPDGLPLLTERTAGYGRVLACAQPLAPDASFDVAFWADLLRREKVPARPWVGSVSTRNVATISGRYHRPR